MQSHRLVFLALLLLVPLAPAQRQGKGEPTPRTDLPHTHDFQKTLRDHLATLSEKDFTHGVTSQLETKPLDKDLDVLYRHHLLTLMNQPLIGSKRGTPAINAPPRLFLLSSIETSKGIMIPPVWPETLASFVRWDYPGNPYFDNKALKLRSYVTAAVAMLLLDDQLAHHPERGGSRADWLAYHLVVYAYPYLTFRDLLPAEVQKAYRTLLRRMGRRVLDWGPKGEEPNFDIITVVGLWYVSKALDDAAFTKEVETFARKLYTDSLHPAGYFHDNRGIDVGYQGMTNYFANWAALASDWPFARDAVDHCYRLRAHLCLPEPDGVFVGPSHFNSRTSSDAWGDQWPWEGARDHAAALVSDEAVYLTKFPTPDELKAAAGKRASAFRGQIAENPVSGKGGFLKNDELMSHPWSWRLWHSFNFPVSLNPGYEHYPTGAYKRLVKLHADKSPLLRSPFLRDESFLRDFAKAFTVTKTSTYAAVVHTGPIGTPGQDDGLFKFTGPLGFGGGQLSAFWTPGTGCVLLGRRGGNSWSKSFDAIEEWRNWPIHAVSGTTHAGKVFTSARIVAPEVASVLEKTTGTVVATGVIPVEQLGQGKVLEGKIRYQRTFTLSGEGVEVMTRVQFSGQDKLTELVESLPVFLREANTQAKASPTTIEFAVGGKWIEAKDGYDKVTAVRLKRFSGAVEVKFDRPRRVRLSPAVWQDTYLSRAACRNVLVDLLDGQMTPTVVQGEKQVRYKISAVGK